MIREELQKAINQQIKQEHAAAFTYLGMAAYFEKNNLSGFAHWCFVQHQEELVHAMRLFKYLLDRGGSVTLEALPAPQCSYPSVEAVFENALKQEQANTASIDHLYEQASAFNDHATISHLQWFVDEQVEEEKSVGEVLSLVQRAQKQPEAILYLNDKLGKRRPDTHPPS